MSCGLSVITHARPCSSLVDYRQQLIRAHIWTTAEIVCLFNTYEQHPAEAGARRTAHSILKGIVRKEKENEHFTKLLPYILMLKITPVYEARLKQYKITMKYKTCIITYDIIYDLAVSSGKQRPII